MSHENFNESKNNFCWKTKTDSIWKDDVDSLDRMVARTLSEAAVYAALLRRKLPYEPTQEKINEAVKKLEENRSWLSDPFPLLKSGTKDPHVIEIIERLQMKCIRDLWDSDDEVSHKITNTVKSLTNLKNRDHK